MNRAIYFNSIEFNLSWLVTSLEHRGGLNLLDLHVHSENFYLDFFNLLFSWELKNLNTEQQNAAGIDLIDTSNKIIVQVSATATRQKIESALAKDLSFYIGYSFKFICISKDAKTLRSNTYANPHMLTFSPADDIFDVSYILKLINSMDTKRLKVIDGFLKQELRREPDSDRVETNLATIIKILAKEDWSHVPSVPETIPYEIEEKISYNQLGIARTLIDDHKIHYSRIDKIYSDFDEQGVNKSLSILNGIRTIYHNTIVSGQDTSSDQRFFLVTEKVIQKIQASTNYTSIPEDELGLSVQILIVDAFIRCKIFENPSRNINAYSG